MAIEQLISINEKRSFLKWFIGRYELKAKECIWLLNYMLNDDHIIGLLRFVETIDNCPRALLISERHLTTPAFLYIKENVETMEPEKAFHDIRLYQDEPIYVQLIFKGANREAAYLSVLEDHPFAELDIEQRYGREAERLLIRSEKQFLLDKLTDEIDKALSEHNQEAFQKLTTQPRALKAKLKKDI